MILHYFRMALRHLNKVKWQALVSVLGLGAGLILFAMCNSFLRSELAANKNLATYDRLVAPTFLRENVSVSSLFKDDGICYKIDAMPQVDAIALTRGTEDCMLSINGEVEINARFACVDGEFGKVFRIIYVAFKRVGLAEILRGRNSFELLASICRTYIANSMFAYTINCIL